MTLTSHSLDPQLIEGTSNECFPAARLPRAARGGSSATRRKESDVRNGHEAKRRQTPFTAHAMLLLQGLSVVTFYLFV